MQSQDRSPGRDRSPRAFRRLLVIGTPRSGTHYAAEVFRRAGVDVRHENTNAGGSVSSFLAVDDYYYHGRHLDGGRDAYEWGTVLHQVREPLACIGSIAGALAENRISWWHWQERHTGISYRLAPVERAARFWLAWNRICEPQAALTYRLEAMREAWPEIARHTGIDTPFPENVDPIAVSERTRVPTSWDYLKSLDEGLCEEIARTAERYGYEVSE